MPYTPALKRAIYKYRETHREEFTEYSKEYRKRYYQENKSKVNAKRLNLYYYQKECNRLRNILLESLD